MYCVNLVLSWNILFSPSIVIESFARYSIQGWHPCSLSVCRTSIQDFLAFKVSIEKLGVILIGLPLYVTWPFSFAALNIFSLFCRFGVLIIMCLGGLLFVFDKIALSIAYVFVSVFIFVWLVFFFQNFL